MRRTFALLDKERARAHGSTVDHTFLIFRYLLVLFVYYFFCLFFLIDCSLFDLFPLSVLLWDGLSLIITSISFFLPYHPCMFLFVAAGELHHSYHHCQKKQKNPTLSD